MQDDTSHDELFCSYYRGNLITSLSESSRFLRIDDEINREFAKAFVHVWSNHKRLWKMKAGRPSLIPRDDNNKKIKPSIQTYVEEIGKFNEQMIIETQYRSFEENEQLIKSIRENPDTNKRRNDAMKKRFQLSHNANVHYYTLNQTCVCNFMFRSADEFVRMLLLLFVDIREIKEKFYMLYNWNSDDVSYLNNMIKDDTVSTSIITGWRDKISIAEEIPDVIYKNMIKYGVNVKYIFRNIDIACITNKTYSLLVQSVSPKNYATEKSNVNVKKFFRIMSNKNANDLCHILDGIENEMETDEDEDEKIQYDMELNIDDLISESSTTSSATTLSSNSDDSESFLKERFQFENISRSMILNRMDTLKLYEHKKNEDSIENSKKTSIDSIHSYTISAVIYSICVSLYNDHELTRLKYVTNPTIDVYNSPVNNKLSNKVDVDVISCYRYAKYCMEHTTNSLDKMDPYLPKSLIDSIKLNISTLKRYILKRNKNVTQDIENDDDLKKIDVMMTYFNDIYNKIDNQLHESICQKQVESNNTMSSYHYRKINSRTLRKYNIVKNKNSMLTFFDRMREVPITSTNVLSTDYKEMLNKKMEESPQVMLVFKRSSEVTVASIMKSMIIIENRFMNNKDIVYHKYDPNENQSIINWDVIFSQTFVTIIMTQSMYLKIVKYYIPMIIDKSYTKRNLFAPLYYIHIHNYYYGENIGLLNTMRSILKHFQYDREYNHSIYMPYHPDDSIIQFYSILHIIVMRYQSSEKIWEALLNPYRNIAHLYTRKNPTTLIDYVVGFSDLNPNIYTALKSFIMVYAKHIVKQDTLFKVYEVMCNNKTLQQEHAMCFLLIQNMINNGETKMYTSSYHEQIYLYVDVDSAFKVRVKDNYVEKDDPSCFDNVFPYKNGVSPIILLFMLCTSNHISNELAIELFTSINIDPHMNVNKKKIVVDKIIVNNANPSEPIYNRTKTYERNVMNSLFRLSDNVSMKRLQNLREMSNVLRDNFFIWKLNKKYLSGLSYNDTLNISYPESSNNIRASDLNAFKFLMQSIEELSHHSINCIVHPSGQYIKYQEPYRGYPDKPHNFLPMSIDSILQGGPDEFPHIPLDVSVLSSTIDKMSVNELENHYSMYDSPNIQYRQRCYYDRYDLSKIYNEKTVNLINEKLKKQEKKTKNNRKSISTLEQKKNTLERKTSKITLHDIENDESPLDKDQFLYILNDVLMFYDNVFPVWNSDIYPSTPIHSKKTTFNMKIRPFMESDQSMLDCILFSPIRRMEFTENPYQSATDFYINDKSRSDNTQSKKTHLNKRKLDNHYENTLSDFGWIDTKRNKFTID